MSVMGGDALAVVQDDVLPAAAVSPGVLDYAVAGCVDGRVAVIGDVDTGVELLFAGPGGFAITEARADPAVGGPL